MNTLTIQQTQIATDLTTGLFNDFIAFIDRGEKTTRTYITNLRQFIAWLRYKSINRPQRADIIAYRDYLAAEHIAIELDADAAEGWRYRTGANGSNIVIKCKPNTVAQYLRSVCQFFKWAAANGLYPNIAENIHAPKINHTAHKKEALTAAEVLTIEKSITARADAKAASVLDASKDRQGRIDRASEQGKRLAAMYILAVNAGLRTIEISRANIGDLELKSGTAYLYIWGKGHSEADQKKILAPGVYEAIKDYLDSRTDAKTASSPLFTATGNRSKGKRIAATTISKMLKQAMKEAGFDSDRLTAHSLRHTAGTNTMNITNDLYLTQQYMRHSNPATTEIYLHCDTEAKEQQTAQQLYNLYHNIEQQDELTAIISKLNASQLQKLATMAAAAMA